MKITTEMLCRADAYPEEVDIFADHWPDGMEVTIDNVRQVLDLELDIDWMVRHLLSDTVERHISR